MKPTKDDMKDSSKTTETYPAKAPMADTDKVMEQIADSVLAVDFPRDGEAFETARLCLMDTLGCGLMALSYPACTKLLGPVVPGADLPGRGARVPGTGYELEPVQAAFNIGAMVRWLDFNDTWLAAEWGHPSDNLGGILAVADYLCRGGETVTIDDLLGAMIQAHEIQGILALENGFNRLGLDHVLLVRIATTAVVTRMLGGTREQIINAVSNAFIDGGALRTYRHAPNTGSRKSWAAGDATSRGVRLAYLALRGEMGYPGALTTKTWGFQDVLFQGNPIVVPSCGFGSYVMENILFKIAFPAEFHAQTAVEAAIRLHPEVVDRVEQVERIVVETQESAVRIIDKTGPLHNPADRDHCLQYMVAVPLLKGGLSAQDYEEDAAKDARIDILRSKMEIVENSAFTRDYLDPDKRSIGNAVQVYFEDGTATERISVEYPVGHRRRREEGVPLMFEKFHKSVRDHYPQDQAASVVAFFEDLKNKGDVPVSEMMDRLI